MRVKIKKRHSKRNMAMTIFLSIAMTMSLAGINTNKCYADENNNDLTLHYDMTYKDGKLIDVSGNGYDAEMVNIADNDFKSELSRKSLNFDGSEKYIKIPSGTVKDENFTIEASYKTDTNADHWLWTLGTHQNNWPNVENYLFVNPLSAQSGYSGKLLGGIKNDSTELRCKADLVPERDKINTVYAVFDSGKLTFYLNGQATETIDSGYSVQNILKADSDDSYIGYIGKSLYAPDPYYTGSLYDFKIYHKALTEKQIKEDYDNSQDEKVDYEKCLESVKENLNIPDADDIRGNITLSTSGEYGTNITWKSSNPDVITDEDEGSVKKGAVTRQDSDTTVKLTATLTLDSYTVQKEFNVNVRAKNDEDDLTHYLFAYFAGQHDENQEQIYFAASSDGLNWTELNSGAPVLTSTLGEKGVRDPFIIRSAEGDKFYLIATDLSIYRNGNWSRAQTSGSKSIMIWESTDLVNWSDERKVKVALDDAGCTWAPEAFYDDSTGEYIVFWASKVGSDNYAKQRIYYSKTRDFYTFSKPEVWLEENYSVIDCTVIKDKKTGYYYRFTKNESKTYVYLERSKSLMGNFEKVAGWDNIAGAEGPTCYNLNGTDDWILLVDYFGKNGYYPYKVDFDSASYSKLEDDSYSLPSKPRHGTVMNITDEEYNNLIKSYGGMTLDYSSIPNVVIEGESSSVLPSSIEASIEGIDESKKTYDVEWNVEDDVFSEPGVVSVNGTVKCDVPKTITRNIVVVRPNTKYFIDCASDVTGNESPYYNDLKDRADLLNEKADQQYDGTWGHTDYTWYVNSSDLGINNCGFYGENDGSLNPTYKIKLNKGTYALDSMQYEWWTGPRTTEVHAVYENADGESQDVILGSSTVSSSSKEGKVSGSFTIDKDDTDVTIIFKRTSGDAGVVSYFAVADLSSPQNEIAKVKIIRNKDLLTAQLLDCNGNEVVKDVQYKWYRNDEVIDDENKNTYKISAEDKGKKINVKIAENNLSSDYIYIDEDNNKEDADDINDTDGLISITSKDIDDGSYDFSKNIIRSLNKLNIANSLEEDDMQNALEEYISNNATTDAAVKVSISDFQLKPSTDKDAGSITGKIMINYDDYTSEYGFKIIIKILENSDVKKIDKSKLQKYYNDYESKTKGRYTDYTWNLFVEARNNAQTILNKDDADQNEIDNALNNLKNAVNGLEEKSSSSSHSSHHDRTSSSSTNDDEKQPEVEILSSSNTVNTINTSNKLNEFKPQWSLIDGKWYMLNKQTGIKLTGWYDDNGTWYYLSENSGEMLTGWFQDKDGQWYYLNESGSMAEGWFKDKNEKWYYLKDNGAMAHDEYIDIYYVDSSGAWIK